MIQTLRKRHRYTWFVLAILLPLGYILSFVSIPEAPIDERNFGLDQVEAKGEVIKSSTGDNVRINLRGEAGKQARQLEIVVLQPLKSAAASVYLNSQPLDNAGSDFLIGQLGPKGDYRFDLDSLQSQYPGFHLLIYDHIKQKTIEQISL